MAKLPSISFTYRQFTSVGPDQVVRVDGEDVQGQRYIQFVNVPGWLRVFNPVWIPGNDNLNWEFDVSVNVRASALNNFAPGTYSASVRVDTYQNGGLVAQGSDTINVTVTVQEGQSLKVSTNNMAFNYTLGGSAPSEKLLNITTPNAWQIVGAPSWLVLSQTSGDGNGTVSFGINTAGLLVQGYTATLAVNDGLNVENVTVTLEVTGQSTELNFLNIHPDTLEFLEEFAKAPTQQKEMTIDASAPWELQSASETWVVLSSESGGTGIEIITVGVDSRTLAVGNHFAQLRFAAGDIVKTINIKLTVVKEIVVGVDASSIYYLGDRPKLNVASALVNSFLRMEGLATTPNKVTPIKKEAPFVDGEAELLIGQEGKTLIERSDLPKTLETTVFVPGEVMALTFELYEINKFSGNTVNRGSFSGIKVLKGETPSIDSKLCYTPDVIHMSNTGIVSLITQENGDNPLIQISGTQTLTSGSILNYQSDVYQGIRDLSLLDYNSGDTCIMDFGKQRVTVNIVKNEPQETMLFFENEWGFFEFFQLRGELTVQDVKDNVEEQYAQNGQEVTEVVQVKQPVQYQVYSGYILTDGERRWLGRITRARRWILLIDGERIPVICTNRNLEVYKTRDYFKSYLLNFKSAVK